MAKMNKKQALPTAGLYVHVPFCVSKCPYCDFYSLSSDEETMDRYVKAVLRDLQTYKGQFLADTVYFGGGTPSLLGSKRIYTLMNTIREWFAVDENAECTLEANPAENLEEVFHAFYEAGGNRISMGLQTADNRLLKKLGRRHTVQQVEKAVKDARKTGFTRISLDMMLGIPDQTREHIQKTAAFCETCGVEHVSSYMLKIEPGTPFALHPPIVPDDEETADLYLFACEQLESRGYKQYEISNFAKPREESRHNLKYWNGEEVLGIGPAAHNFWDGKRTYYERDLSRFLEGTQKAILAEANGMEDGSKEEYAMLRLRLNEGLLEEKFEARYGEKIPQIWRDRAAKIPSKFIICDEKGIRLTREGFLLSNAILTEIL